ncbi:MAG: cation:proton antiporter [Candidatus Binataceae bacterium]
MPHETSLIFTLAIGFVAALAGGMIAVRMGLPPIVGYLIAGIAIGPFSPGIAADVKIAGQLAEIGVMLMMFGIGMHFSLEELWAVRRVAIPGALVQIAFATALGAAAAHLWGWPAAAGLVFGLALSVASTVVVFRALEERGVLASADGHIAAGWLVVEDLVTVLILVMLPVLARVLDNDSASRALASGAGGPALEIGITIAKVAAFAFVMPVLGVRILPWLLERVVRTGSRELFTLAVAAIAIGVACGAAELFGVSFALGAFLAGVVVGESDHSGRAAAEMQPLQDVFTVLFFVAVGMLCDPAIIRTSQIELATAVAIIVLGKPIAAFILIIALRYPLGTALTVAASLAQIGEFSFILGDRGASLGLLPHQAQGLIVVGALASIALNPLAFRAAAAIEKRFAA